MGYKNIYQSFKINTKYCKIGKDKDECQIFIDPDRDNLISANHGAFKILNNGDLYYKDLGSTNGSFLKI